MGLYVENSGKLLKQAGVTRCAFIHLPFKLCTDNSNKTGYKLAPVIKTEI